CKYKIIIKTGCVWLAGTNANVDIIFTSLSGVILAYQNIDHKNYDDFERCNTDVFNVQGTCLSEYDKICKVIVSHDNTGSNAGWYIDWIDFSTPSNNFAVHFDIGTWIEQDNLAYVGDTCIV
ncbi:hypothetical protein SELMODRAFT_98734, partial [Selaginella moellendorffii]